METLGLIDADQFFYQITSALEEEVDLNAEVHSNFWMFEADTCLLSNVAEARKQLVTKFNGLASQFTRIILCFTSTPNFRHDVLPTYKGGRLKKRKPLGYWRLVEEFTASEYIETRKIPGLEADDVMSILATNPKYRRQYPGGVTILSNDKDMKQVPDTRIKTKDGSFTYSLADADVWRYTQALSGDPTDGYTGLPGWGAVRAGKYLDPLRGMEEQVLIDAVVSAYTDSGSRLSEAYAQINCARILRYGEYNFPTSKPILIP